MTAPEPQDPTRPTAAGLFAELVDCDPATRSAKLAELAARDASLAGLVERMLTADAAAEGPLERLQGEVADAAAYLLPGTVQPPFERLGAWRLGARLGVGGMGEVWEGERELGGFAQRAAVKLVKAGFATAALVARFELERQVLARLEHPAIARLLDGGMAPDGRPWFAMERVDGEPITAWADRAGLSTARRIALMVEVCAAVDAAHRSLVVHRDLKPSNILVTGEGRPKLLDFGLAKLLEAEFDAAVTRTELRALTPAYAAPEQVLGEPVTTATDVYSLGVVLFELLTGELPHRRPARSGVELEREVERETVEGPTAVARRAGRETLPRRLGTELDTIVLKALRREPARRYPTAAALAEDLVRLLDGRPISARPDTVGYRAAKFVRRHRVGVAATLLVALSLVGGLALALVSARRAERQALRAGEVQKFLVGLFEAADPGRSLGAEVTARQLLDAGVRQLEGGLKGEPEVQADLFDTVARIEHRIGRFESAERLARGALERRQAAFGEGSADVAEVRLTLAEALFGRGELEPAAEQFRAALAVLERAVDPADPRLMRAGLGAAEAELYVGNKERAFELAEQVLSRAIQTHGADDATTASARLAYGQMLTPDGRFQEAVKQFELAIEVLDRTLGADHPRSSEARLALAETAGYLGDRPRAHQLFDQATAALRRVLGDDHPQVGQAHVKHALIWLNDGRPDRAEAALAEALAIFAALDHFEAASCERLLGHALLVQGRPAEAAQRFESALEQFRTRLGEDHIYTLVALGNLGTARVREGRPREALDPLRRAIAGIEATAGRESDDLRQPLLSLGEAERMLGNREAALEHHRRALAITESLLGSEHNGAANARREIAFDLAQDGSAAALAEALEQFDRALAIRRPGDSRTERFASWLEEAAALARRAGDSARATAWQSEAAAIRAGLAEDV